MNEITINERGKKAIQVGAASIKYEERALDRSIVDQLNEVDRASRIVNEILEANIPFQEARVQLVEALVSFERLIAKAQSLRSHKQLPAPVDVVRIVMEVGDGLVGLLSRFNSAEGNRFQDRAAKATSEFYFEQPSRDVDVSAVMDLYFHEWALMKELALDPPLRHWEDRHQRVFSDTELDEFFRTHEMAVFHHLMGCTKVRYGDHFRIQHENPLADREKADRIRAWQLARKAPNQISDHPQSPELEGRTEK